MRSHRESHLVSRIGWLRAAVLGANDGIVSTASLIMGVAASGAPGSSASSSGPLARSRCTTALLHPAAASVLPAASATATDRCRPPVQPNATVR